MPRAGPQIEPAAVLVGTLLGGFWSFIKGQEWFAKVRSRRYYKAVQALEAGVNQTYQEYVRALKQGREDGKLTSGERRRARNLAREAAVSFGRTEGVDVLKELGDQYLDTWIAKIVRKMKK